MGLIPTLISFTPGTDIKASEANANNAAIVAAVNGTAMFTDVAKTVVVQHAFSPGTVQAPFLLGSNAQGQLVAGLRAASAVLADTATALATPRTINGVSFDGTGNITVTAAASTLTGSTLASGVTISSLQVVGTLLGLDVSGTVSAIAVTASTFTGNGTGLVNIPQTAVTNLVTDLAAKSATSHTHTSFGALDLNGSITFPLNGGAARNLPLQMPGHAFPGTQVLMRFGCDYDHSGAVTPVAIDQAPTGTGAYRWRWNRLQYIDSAGAVRDAYLPFLSQV